jgi:uncharacterized surface anchored protein
LNGKKFLDANDNGASDNGESGLGGVTITITGFTGYGTQITQTVVTAGDGSFSFGSLQPGTYKLCETVPTGYTQTYPGLTSTVTGGTSTSCTNGSRGWSVTLGSGVTFSNLSFGNVALYKIIVLVCRQSDNSLYPSTVTVDGTNKTSLATGDTHPAQSAVTMSDATLCSIGGASYGDKAPGNHPGNVSIP